VRAVFERPSYRLRDAPSPGQSYGLLQPRVSSDGMRTSVVRNKFREKRCMLFHGVRVIPFLLERPFYAERSRQAKISNAYAPCPNHFSRERKLMLLLSRLLSPFPSYSMRTQSLPAYDLGLRPRNVMEETVRGSIARFVVYAWEGPLVNKSRTSEEDRTLSTIS
jgi:hypothetical protein